MSEPTDIAGRTSRFNEAARAYTPPSTSRHAKLMPFKDGIVELRQKGGSLRLIRELLATVGVAVGTDTIARFIAEVNGEPLPERTAKRTQRRRVIAPGVNAMRPAAEPASALPLSRPSTPQSAPEPAPHNDASAERPRIRGPRIADPRNL
jgi:hypothetical protein